MPDWEEYYGTTDPDELNDRFMEDCRIAAHMENESDNDLSSDFTSEEYTRLNASDDMDLDPPHPEICNKRKQNL